MTREFSAQEVWLHGSFLPVIAHLGKKIDPARVLEWGPGPSTIAIAKAFPNAEILTIEHDLKWIEAFEQMLTTQDEEIQKRVTIRHIPLGGHGESGGYVTYPLYLRKGFGQCFDFAFIDGRHRADCLTVAHSVLSPQGVVVLHDAHRKKYFDHSTLFRCSRVYRKQRVAVFSGLPLSTYLNDFTERGFGE